jgi:hypothetical protein
MAAPENAHETVQKKRSDPRAGSSARSSDDVAIGFKNGEAENADSNQDQFKS